MPVADRFEGVFRSLMALTRSASQLNAQDVGFLRSLDRNVASRSSQLSERILRILKNLAEASADETIPAENLQELQEGWNGIVGVFDTLFERIDYSLDGFDETRFGPGASSFSSAPPSGTASPKTPEPTGSAKMIYYDKNIERPQDKFKRPVDNSLSPFKPLLAEKPHALARLGDVLKLQPADAEHAKEWYPQPYEAEIRDQAYPPSVYERAQPGEPTPISETPLTFVSTPKQLRKMRAELAKATEFAVDLEHHDYRSYLGIVSLMQISTSSRDWIIDTLALRTELQQLNSVFCDPNILKVFHGATHDVQWLQRDLGIYVVSLFDTYHASRALNLSKHSLAFLLQEYVNFTADKKYQMADWRLRPLTPEMQQYARADTHFLLYIYQTMRNQLLDEDPDKGLLNDVLASSRKVALTRYEKPEYTNQQGLANIVMKFRLSPYHETFAAAIYNWRDAKAREIDESPRFVMPNAFLVAMATKRPRTASGVLGVSRDVPPLVRRYAEELARLMEATQKQAESKPTALAQDPKPSLQPSKSIDVFSAKSINDVKSLRKPASQMFAAPKSQLSARPTIFLGVVDVTQLSAVEPVPDNQEGLASPEAGLDADTEPVAAKPPVPAADSATEQKSPSNGRSKGNGKRKRVVNVVDGIDDAELITTHSAPNSRQLIDEPAFDFASSELADQPAEQTARRQNSRPHENGPRPAKYRRKIQGIRSKTFK